MIYRRLVRPLVFSIDPERAHELTMGALARGHPLIRLVPRLRVEDPRLEQTLMGIRFPNPVGLAAGFDKRARAVPAWAALGFGFAEIGTVTALAQPGSDRPRILRLPRDRAIVNRLGFNNDGAERTAETLARWKRRGSLNAIPLGVNIGKSKVASLGDALADYRASFERLRPYADYVAVNVSSPNTPGLRRLQDKDRLRELLSGLAAVDRARATHTGERPRPLLVKVAPDLTIQALDEVVQIALDLDLDGLIVSNTTLSRDGLLSPPRPAWE